MKSLQAAAMQNAISVINKRAIQIYFEISAESQLTELEIIAHENGDNVSKGAIAIVREMFAMLKGEQK